MNEMGGNFQVGAEWLPHYVTLQTHDSGDVDKDVWRCLHITKTIMTEITAKGMMTERSANFVDIIMHVSSQPEYNPLVFNIHDGQ